MATNDPRTPTRDEFAQFLPTQRLIRAFEQLFRLVPNQLNINETLIQEANIDAGTAISKATQAIDGLVLAERRAKSNGVLVWLSM